MAIIQLNYTNPDFGFIIRKNPESGMQLKNIRQGIAFGWYSNNNTTFNIFFKDADNAVSFGDQEFEYLDTTRYNSPVFVLNAISEFFSSTVKEEIDVDKQGEEKSLYINMVNIKHKKQIYHFKKYFSEFKIEMDNYVAKSFSLKLSTTESFHKLLNYTNLMMIFIVITSDEYIQLDQNSVEKYLASIEKLDAPFFIRYLFARNMFRSKKQFEKYKTRLETTNRYDSINMAFGDTATQRRNEIRKIFQFDKPIVDVGCGEGFYAIPFSMNLSDDKIYHAIDIVPELTDAVKKKAAKKELKNIQVYNHIDEFIETYDGGVMDILLTEVIEHMPQDQSIELLNGIIENIKFDKFVVTVPNQDFNQFYMIGDGEYRHKDHDWEPTEVEFQTFMKKVIPDDYKLNFVNIGDTIDGISTSIGCVITK